MLCLIGQKDSGYSYRINNSKLSQKILSCSIFFDETHIKRCIVSNHNTVLGKIQKRRKYFFNARSIHHIVIGNGCQLGNPVRNRFSRIYKSGIPLCNLSVLHLYSANFDNVILNRRKTGSLNIKYHIILVNIQIFGVIHDLFGIINQISFYPQNNLKEILSVRNNTCFFATFLFRIPQITPGMKHIRKRMHYSVVCYGNRRMSPFIGTLDNINNIGNTIHITHFGMAMQFHSFISRVIHPLGRKIVDFFDNQSTTANRQFMIKLVNGNITLDFYKGSFFGIKTLEYFVNAFIFHKLFDHNRIRKIGHS